MTKSEATTLIGEIDSKIKQLYDASIKVGVTPEARLKLRAAIDELLDERIKVMRYRDVVSPPVTRRRKVVASSL